jgi:uncharacterized membrane protein YccC
MASRQKTLPIAVYIEDLAATIEDTNRTASSITRELSQRAERQERFRAAADNNVRHMYALLAISSEVIEQSRRLCENLREARQTLQDVRRELAKLRTG